MALVCLKSVCKYGGVQWIKYVGWLQMPVCEWTVQTHDWDAPNSLWAYVVCNWIENCKKRHYISPRSRLHQVKQLRRQHKCRYKMNNWTHVWPHHRKETLIQGTTSHPHTTGRTPTHQVTNASIRLLIYSQPHLTKFMMKTTTLVTWLLLNCVVMMTGYAVWFKMTFSTYLLEQTEAVTTLSLLPLVTQLLQASHPTTAALILVHTHCTHDSETSTPASVPPSPSPSLSTCSLADHFNIEELI